MVTTVRTRVPSGVCGRYGGGLRSVSSERPDSDMHAVKAYQRGAGSGCAVPSTVRSGGASTV